MGKVFGTGRIRERWKEFTSTTVQHYYIRRIEV